MSESYELTNTMKEGRASALYKMSEQMILDAFVEIPTGCQNKYQYDEEAKAFRLDRVLFSPFHYPTEYGHVEHTLAEDGDPLDIMVVVTQPTFPGCLIRSRVIGVLLMSDEAGRDEKLLAVPVDDPRFRHVEQLEDLAPHLTQEIRHFFETYKQLEGKEVRVEGWGDLAVAKKVYDDAVVRYAEKRADNPA